MIRLSLREGEGREEGKGDFGIFRRVRESCESLLAATPRLTRIASSRVKFAEEMDLCSLRLAPFDSALPDRPSIVEGKTEFGAMLLPQLR